MSNPVTYATDSAALAESPTATKKKTILLCFNEEERGSFWSGGPALDELAKELDAELHWELPPGNDEEWARLLLDLRPEVVVSAWSIPFISPAILRELPEFKYLCHFCGAVRGKVPREFIERGGLVTNWGAVAAEAVAECALALVLACARRITRYTFEMHQDKRWLGLGRPAPISLRGRRVGIHGFGAVARHCVKLLQPFGVEIECWSEGVPPELFELHATRRAADLESLFLLNDIVIEAEALTPQNVGSVTRELLARMVPGSILVNVGRGQIFEPGAVEALAQREDVTIGLDVYNEEPLPADSPLIGRRNVTLLPHTAGPTLDQYPQIRRRCLALLKKYVAGRPLPEAITLQAYDRMT